MASDPNDAPRRVSLRDVAREIGVSHVTVSLALRGDPRVSVERRREVEEVARRLGYRPDPMLSALSAFRQSKRPAAIHSAIAWLNQWPQPKDLCRHREFQAYWEGASETAERLGYHLEEFIVPPDMHTARLEKILATRNIRGILIPPHSYGLDLPEFNWGQFSVVRFGISVQHPRAHIVTSDQSHCGSLAFGRANEYGYRRIGYVTARRFERNTNGNFRAGFLAAQDAAVPLAQHVPVLTLETEEEANSRAADDRSLRAWLEEHRPDALVTTVSRLHSALPSLGYRVPEDIAVAALSLLDGNFDAGVDQNSREIGRVAMSTLAGFVHQNERGIPQYMRRVLVEGRWVDGSSLPRKNTQAGA
jgi:LacI family transcriptional regulator